MRDGLAQFIRGSSSILLEKSLSYKQAYVCTSLTYMYMGNTNELLNCLSMCSCMFGGPLLTSRPPRPTPSACVYLKGDQFTRGKVLFLPFPRFPAVPQSSTYAQQVFRQRFFENLQNFFIFCIKTGFFSFFAQKCMGRREKIDCRNAERGTEAGAHKKERESGSSRSSRIP